MSDFIDDESYERRKKLTENVLADADWAVDLILSTWGQLEAAEERIAELEHSYEVLAHSCSDRAEDAAWKLHAAEAKLATVDALCARHDITVAGIVALVDELFTDAPYDEHLFTSQRGLYSAMHLRRLAREENQ